MGYVFFSFILLFALLLIPFSSAAASGAAEGLKLFALSVLPCLFPFLVCANCLLKSGRLHITGKSRLRFLLPALLAAVCGTPSAALICGGLYKEGAVGRRFASALCAIMNLAGPIFVINVVAKGFCLDARLALLFGFSHYAPALAAALILGFAGGKSGDRVRAPLPKARDTPAAVFSGAISDSVMAALRIGGTIVFFRVVHSVFEASTASIPIPGLLRGAVTGLAEMTNGLELVSRFHSKGAAALCAFLLSFGGVCIFIQSRMIFEQLDAKVYFAVKAAFGAVSAAAALTAYGLIPSAEPVFSFTGEAAAEIPHDPTRIISMLCIFLAACASLLFSLLFSRFLSKK